MHLPPAIQKELHIFYAHYIMENQVPTQLLFYEDLKENSSNEMRKVMSFLKTNYNFAPADATRRMKCLGPGLIENNGVIVTYSIILNYKW